MGKFFKYKLDDFFGFEPNDGRIAFKPSELAFGEMIVGVKSLFFSFLERELAVLMGIGEAVNVTSFSEERL